MSKVRITQIGISELKQLQQLARKTFFETFAEFNSEQNMNNYLEVNLGEERLSVELNNPNSEFYFARLDSKVIGYLKVNFGPAQTELTDENSLEIERIYVDKEFLGKNVGQLLYQKAIEIAQQRSMKYVWLAVWEQNPRAISFYKKNGFVEFDKHIFILGDDEQMDLMMRKELV